MHSLKKESPMARQEMNDDMEPRTAEEALCTTLDSSIGKMEIWAATTALVAGQFSREEYADLDDYLDALEKYNGLEFGCDTIEASWDEYRHFIFEQVQKFTKVELDRRD